MTRAACVIPRLAVLASLLGAAAASHAVACELEEGTRHAVTRVLDGETLALDDGRELRLVGALAPRAFDSAADATAWAPEREAREALERLVLGRSVELAFSGPRLDRYGRLRAHVFVDAQGDAAKLWLQGAMLEAGHARAAAQPGAEDCLPLLIAREAEARTARRGIWANAAYAVRDAHRPYGLLRYRATFQLVEGRIRRVAVLSNRIYLNFGDDWRRDFTIGVRRRAKLDTAGDTAALTSLVNARVLVRGWIERRNGPFVELTDLAALQVLEAAAAASADAPPPAAAAPVAIPAPAPVSAATRTAADR